MDNAMLALMQFLSSKSFWRYTDAEHAIHMTRRQVSYRVNQLNKLLKKEHVAILPIGSSFTKEMIIPDETQKAIKRLLLKMNRNDVYYLNKKERLIYMYLMLFMNSSYLSLFDFIDSIGVSRSTVLLDFKELIQLLKEGNVSLCYNRSKGYYLEGFELDIRRMMMKLVIYKLAQEQNKTVFDVFIDDYHLDIFDYSRLVISELAQRCRIRFVEDRLTEFIYIFIFLKARMQNGKNTDQEIAHLIDMDAMSTMKEYEFVRSLLQNYKNVDRIREADVKYITAWILGISFGDIHEDSKDCVQISDLIGKIMTRFESLSGAHYRNTEEIFTQLYAHFRPAYYRLLFRLPIVNPLRDKVKEEYWELYQLVGETMKPFHVLFGEEIPEDEIAYLTMHFATIYSSDKRDFLISSPKTALVICLNGVGGSAILYNELTGMFPELHFLPPLETTHLQDFKEHADIIFSTNDLMHVSKDIPVIRVNPLMSIAERYQVVREVYMQLGSRVLKRPDVDVVMHIIAKYTPLPQEEALYQELLTYFASIDEMGHHKKNLYLENMVRPEIIRLHIVAKNWEEAVRMAYEPLVQQGFITQNYVEETVRSIRFIGPYIVITKHVALSHTKPQAGALGCALGIAVLSNPIAFGNADHDPIKYIFSLSATDNEAHLCAMAELVELFHDKRFYALLDTAKSPSQIMQYLKRKQRP